MNTLNNQILEYIKYYNQVGLKDSITKYEDWFYNLDNYEFHYVIIRIGLKLGVINTYNKILTSFPSKFKLKIDAFNYMDSILAGWVMGLIGYKMCYFAGFESVKEAIVITKNSGALEYNRVKVLVQTLEQDMHKKGEFTRFLESGKLDTDD